MRIGVNKLKLCYLCAQRKTDYIDKDGIPICAECKERFIDRPKREDKSFEEEDTLPGH